MSYRIVVNTESLDQISSAMDKVLQDLHANSKALEKAFTDLHTYSEGQYFERVNSQFVSEIGWGNQLVDHLYNKIAFVNNVKTAFIKVESVLAGEISSFGDLVIASSNGTDRSFVDRLFAFKEDADIPVIDIKDYPKTNLSWYKQIIQGKSSEKRMLDMQTKEATAQMKEIYTQYNGKWDRFNMDERHFVLQMIENKMALIQGREPVRVILDPNYEGGDLSGIYSKELDQIAINKGLSFQESMNTVIHEGRHAFQKESYYNDYNKDDFADAQLWGYNMNESNYYNANPKDLISRAIYRRQPVEWDAKQYADHITNQL